MGFHEIEQALLQASWGAHHGARTGVQTCT